MLTNPDRTPISDRFGFLIDVINDPSIARGDAMNDIWTLFELISIGNANVIAQYITFLIRLNGLNFFQPNLSLSSLLAAITNVKIDTFATEKGAILLRQILKESGGLAIGWCALIASKTPQCLFSLFADNFWENIKLPADEFWPIWVVLCLFKADEELRNHLFIFLSNTPSLYWIPIFHAIIVVAHGLNQENEFILHNFLIAIGGHLLTNEVDRESLRIFLNIAVYFLFFRIGCLTIFDRPRTQLLP
jgi:hypothetical protein